MSEARWFRSSPVFDTVPEVIDSDKGIMRGVAIVREGEAKGHGVHLDSDFVADVVRLGNDKENGVKMRFGHPTMSGNALGTFLGRAKNFRVDGEIARADMFLSQEAKDTPNGNLWKYTIAHARNSPDMFGASIVFTRGDRFQKDDDGNRVDTSDRDKKTFVSIEKLHGADMVDSPAATDGVFSAFSRDSFAGTVTDFLDQHPEVFDLVRQNPDVLTGFMARYQEYRERQDTTTMSTPETIETDPATTEADASSYIAGAEELEADEASDVLADATPAATISDPEPEQDPEAVVTLSGLQALTAEFGAEIAMQAVLTGGGHVEAQALKILALEAGLEQARAALAHDDGEPEGATFQDGEGGEPQPRKPSKYSHLSPAMARAAQGIANELTQ